MRDLADNEFVWRRIVTAELSEVRVALETDPDLQAVVDCGAAVDFVVHLLHVGVAPDHALTSWEDHAEAQLSLRDRFPGRVTLVNGSVGDYGTHSVAQEIAEHTGIVLQVPNPDGEIESNGLTSLNEQAAVGLQMSARLLLGLPRPKQLLEDLSQDAINFSSSADIPELVRKFIAVEIDHAEKLDASNKTSILLESTRKRAKQLSSEKIVLIQQLHKTQEDLVRSKTRYDSTLPKIEMYRKGREYRKARIAELEEKIAVLRRGKTHRLKVVEGLKADLRRKQDENQKLQRDIKKLKASRSWRYTRYFRRVNGAQSSKYSGMKS